MGTGTDVSTGETITAAKMNKKLEEVVNADVGDAAAIIESKLNLDKGTQANFDKIGTDIGTHASAAGAHHTKTIDASELSAGTLPLARLVDIVNTQIAADAAIAGSKLALADTLTEEMCKSSLLELIVNQGATVADWQTNPGTGTADLPEQLNDGSPDSYQCTFNGVGQYVIVDYAKEVIVKRVRIDSAAEQNEDGRFTIQVWKDGAWVDWILNVPTYNGAGYGGYTVGVAIATTKVKVIATVIDTSEDNSKLGQMQVVY